MLVYLEPELISRRGGYPDVMPCWWKLVGCRGPSIREAGHDHPYLDINVKKKKNSTIATVWCNGRAANHVDPFRFNWCRTDGHSSVGWRIQVQI
jgi:hypothetical protein